MSKLKDKSLKYNKIKFNVIIKLSKVTLHEISLWKIDLLNEDKPLRYPKISITIYTDGSLENWGASSANVFCILSYFSHA